MLFIHIFIVPYWRCKPFTQHIYFATLCLTTSLISAFRIIYRFEPFCIKLLLLISLSCILFITLTDNNVLLCFRNEIYGHFQQTLLIWNHTQYTVLALSLQLQRCRDTCKIPDRCLPWRGKALLSFPGANTFTTTPCMSIVSLVSQMVFYLPVPSTIIRKRD